MSVIRISSLVISAAMLFASSAYAATAQEKAAEKAAFALNASADAVKVTEVKRSGIKITYQAHYSGGIYNCYYTSVGIASDALCSGPINDNPNAPKPHSGAGCNALLKAAGRCE